MPFIVDIYPASFKVEAAAALGLAINERKSRGFPGRRQHEEIETLARLSLPLYTATWESGPGGCQGLVVDPQGLLTGRLEFDLSPVGPTRESLNEMGEESFLTYCQQLIDQAYEVYPEMVEVPGLVSEPEEVKPLLKEDQEPAVDAGLEQPLTPDQVVEDLKQKLQDYHDGAESWKRLRQELLAHRDRLTQNLNKEATEAREASDEALDELQQEVGSAIAVRRQEIEDAREEARREHRKHKEILEQELKRFKKEYQQSGEEFWRDKIKDEEERLAQYDQKLNETLSQLDEEERKFTRSQEKRINDFHEERKKRLDEFEQRLQRLNKVMAETEKSIEFRLERFARQPKKVADLTVNLLEEQCETSFPLIFYAALYPGGRWQVFPPQQLSQQGIKGKFTRFIGVTNLPFRSASRLGEELAEKLQSTIPGHTLEKHLKESNLLSSSDFVKEAKAGLSQLIDRKEVDAKHSGMFDEF